MTIENEQLHLGTVTRQDKDKRRKSKGGATRGPAPAGPATHLPPAQQQQQQPVVTQQAILQQFVQATNVRQDIANQCLVGNQWDLQQALNDFQTLQVCVRTLAASSLHPRCTLTATVPTCVLLHAQLLGSPVTQLLIASLCTRLCSCCLPAEPNHVLTAHNVMRICDCGGRPMGVFQPTTFNLDPAPIGSNIVWP